MFAVTFFSRATAVCSKRALDGYDQHFIFESHRQNAWPDETNAIERWHIYQNREKV